MPASTPRSSFVPVFVSPFYPFFCVSHPTAPEQTDARRCPGAQRHSAPEPLGPSRFVHSGGPGPTLLAASPPHPPPPPLPLTHRPVPLSPPQVVLVPRDLRRLVLFCCSLPPAPYRTPLVRLLPSPGRPHLLRQE